jgi:hypothetical protein
MPWLSVNQIGEVFDSAVPTPFLALDVQRASMPGAPGAKSSAARIVTCLRQGNDEGESEWFYGIENS